MFKCGKANEIYAFVAGVAGAEASGHREIMMVLNTCLFLRTKRLLVVAGFLVIEMENRF